MAVGRAMAVARAPVARAVVAGLAAQVVIAAQAVLVVGLIPMGLPDRVVVEVVDAVVVVHQQIKVVQEVG